MIYMQALGPDPFFHALALAWSDGIMTATEFAQLDALQAALGLSDAERAEIESKYETALVAGTAPTGENAESLVEWIDAVRALKNVHPDISSGLARRLGATALRAGLHPCGYIVAYDWMTHLGLDRPFAEGAWMVGGVAPAIKAVPLALAPVAHTLNLLE
ncbi:MAG: hypothetical protein CMA73_02370 [Euryarchaeota archaeon]|nr:hypothetical protein [Euryarchaeota archaeon]MBN74513.1 hypothetical protein [Euryarchaeota archaeon]